MVGSGGQRSTRGGPDGNDDAAKGPPLGGALVEVANWRLALFDVGFFFAFAVAGLGLLGALKALLSAPRPRY